MANTIFSQRLREQRTINGFSYKALGNLTGVSDVAVLKWEKGLSEPSLNNFKMLCKVLDVSADYLLGLSDVY